MLQFYGSSGWSYYDWKVEMYGQDAFGGITGVDLLPANVPDINIYATNVTGVAGMGKDWNGFIDETWRFNCRSLKARPEPADLLW